MIKISPFTPLFFDPSTDKFGAVSKYVQLFSPADRILIEVLAEGEPVTGSIVNQIDGSETAIVFTSFTMASGTAVHYSVLTGMADGFYTVRLCGYESDIFKVTTDECELSETTLIRYSMRSNKLRKDCVFWHDTVRLFFEFRVPGGFKDDDWSFSVNNEQFETDDGNIVELYAIESTQKRFTLGNAVGCPIWYGEHLNRILCCSDVYFNGRRFVRKGNSAPEVTKEVTTRKSYIFKVSLQGMVDNIDIDFPEGGSDEPGGGGEGFIYLIKIGDEVKPTDKNTFSALRILFEIEQAIKKNNDLQDGKYIHKDMPDFTKFLLKLFGGVEIGKFVSGMIGGSGAAITVDQYGKTTYEGDRMILREELVVPKITFNCIDVISGDKANSFCFGTIKSVDSVHRTATLDLLDDQLGTLKVNDICRGIFHNIEGGNKVEDAYDENGFLGYAGFSTSYFTPVEILENKPGSFSFRYEIQPGTSVHPLPGMNFFGYGNFTDKQRQAITYENRYYTRRLTGVNVWVINPDSHISMQDGLLEGLTIGGQEMHGYGTFQTNSYFTGVQIQFTPEQLEDLKGQDAYSVNLSDYEGVVVVDDEGNILGGISGLQNVVTDGKNVTADGKNVILRDYKLKTQIQAFKGKTEMFHSPVYKEESYTIGLDAVGCTAFVVNGVVVVSSVTDYEDCHVDIAVNCEGNAVFRKTYRVTVVRNGRSPITADLTDDMHAVRCNDAGKVLGDLPLTTTASMSYGTIPLSLSRIVLDTPVGVTATADAATGTITVSGITDAAARDLNIGITLYATYAGEEYHRKVTFVIIKVVPGENGMVYQLLPSVDKVSIDKTGAYSSSSLYCSVTQSDGKALSVLSSLPSELTMKYSCDGGAEVAYSYKSNVLLAGKTQHVRFHLYYKGVLVDRETILIVSDGADGGKGDKGDKGDDGANANYYSISPLMVNIGHNSLGTLEPEYATFTCYKSTGNSQITETAQWVVYGSNDNSTWVQIYSYTSYAASYNMRPDARYIYYKIVAKPYSNITCEARAQIVKDGEPGSNEAAGAMPVNCGAYNSGTTYYYNPDRRDIVTYNGGVYQVKNYRKASGISGYPPTNTDYWTQASRDTFRAMDTALIEGANIANFLFKDGVMRSQDEIASGVPNMILNGKAGMMKVGDFYFYGAPTASQGIYYSMDNKQDSRYGTVCIQPRAMHTVPRNALSSANGNQLNVLMHLARARDDAKDRALYAEGISEFNGRVAVSSVNAAHTTAALDKPALFVEGGMGMQGVFHCEPVEIDDAGMGSAQFSSLYKVSGEGVVINLSNAATDIPAGTVMVFITMGTNSWELKYDRGIYTRGQGLRTVVSVTGDYEIWRVYFPTKGGPAYAGYMN